MSNLHLDYLNQCFVIDKSIEDRKPYKMRKSHQTLYDINPWGYFKHEDLHNLIKYLPIRSLEDALSVKISLEDRANRGYYFVHTPYPEEFHSEEDYLFTMLSAGAIACTHDERFSEFLPDVGYRTDSFKCYLALLATVMIFEDFSVDMSDNLLDIYDNFISGSKRFSYTELSSTYARNLKGLIYLIYRERLQQEKEYEQLRKLQNAQSFFHSEGSPREKRYYKES